MNEGVKSMSNPKECPNCGSTEFKVKEGKFNCKVGNKVRPNFVLGCGAILMLFASSFLVIGLYNHFGIVSTLIAFAVAATPGVFVLLLGASLGKGVGMLTEYSCKACKYYWETRDDELLLDGKYSPTQRIEHRLKQGIVFIPQGMQYRFPNHCINCLRPSTETKQLKKSRYNSQTDVDILSRKTITTSSTSTLNLVGIPYCGECAKKGTPGIKIEFSEDAGGRTFFHESKTVPGVYLNFKNLEFAKRFLDANIFFQN